MSKKGFVSVGFIIVMTTIITVSIGNLAISNNLRRIANFKNESRYYYHLTKSTHNYVYIKLLEYIDNAFINTELRLKNEFSSRVNDENIYDEFIKAMDRFNIVFMEELNKNASRDIRRYISAINFSDCNYEITYFYKGYRGPCMIVISSKYIGESIRKEYVVQYTVNPPILDMDDFINILEGNRSSFSEKYKSVVNVGSSYDGF